MFFFFLYGLSTFNKSVLDKAHSKNIGAKLDHAGNSGEIQFFNWVLSKLVNPSLPGTPSSFSPLFLLVPLLLRRSLVRLRLSDVGDFDVEEEQSKDSE